MPASEIYIDPSITGAGADVILVGGACYQKVGPSNVAPDTETIDGQFDNCDSCSSSSSSSSSVPCNECSNTATTLTVFLTWKGTAIEDGSASGNIDLIGTARWQGYVTIIGSPEDQFPVTIECSDDGTWYIFADFAGAYNYLYANASLNCFDGGPSGTADMIGGGSMPIGCGTITVHP